MKQEYFSNLFDCSLLHMSLWDHVTLFRAHVENISVVSDESTACDPISQTIFVSWNGIVPQDRCGCVQVEQMLPHLLVDDVSREEDPCALRRPLVALAGHGTDGPKQCSVG